MSGSKRRSKGEAAVMLAYSLKLIKWNRTPAQIKKALMEEYQLTVTQAYRVYLKALAAVKEDCAENVDIIRNKRISSTTHAIQEALKNYQDEIDDPTLKLKYLELYVKLLQGQDKYYANRLEPVSKETNQQININFVEAIKPESTEE